MQDEEKEIERIEKVEDRQIARVDLEIKKSTIATLPELNTTVKNINELKKSEIKEIAIEKIKEKICSDPQQQLFSKHIIKEIEAAYEKTVNDYIRNIIETPRIMLQQSGNIKSGFHDFNLDTKNLNFQPVSEEILVKKLREQNNNLDIITGAGRIILHHPDKIIVNELSNFPEIDYDEQSDLLFKLADQVIEKFKSRLNDDQIINVIQYHKKEIGQYIYAQMM